MEVRKFGPDKRGGKTMPKVLNKRTDFVPPDAILVDRTTKWGNPYRIGDSKWRLGIAVGLGESDKLTREEAIERYRWRLFCTEIGATLLSQIGELMGHDLVCWDAPLPCHADILLRLANYVKVPYWEKAHEVD